MRDVKGSNAKNCLKISNRYGAEMKGKMFKSKHLRNAGEKVRPCGTDLPYKNQLYRIF